MNSYRIHFIFAALIILLSLSAAFAALHSISENNNTDPPWPCTKTSIRSLSGNGKHDQASTSQSSRFEANRVPPCILPWMGLT